MMVSATLPTRVILRWCLRKAVTVWQLKRNLEAKNFGSLYLIPYWGEKYRILVVMDDWNESCNLGRLLPPYGLINVLSAGEK